MKKRSLFVLGSSLLGAGLIVTGLTGCQASEHKISFFGDHYSIAGKEGRNFTFKTGEKINFQVANEPGYEFNENIICKFGNDVKEKGVDYNFDKNYFTIEKAPNADVVVSFETYVGNYSATFIGSDSTTYSVAGPTNYHYNDRLEYTLTCADSLSGIFPESDIRVYFGGVLQTKGDTYEYIASDPANDTTLYKTAKLTIKSAPSCNMQIGLVSEGNHVAYFEGINAKADGKVEPSYKNYKLVKEHENVTFNITADNYATLPTADEIEVYSGSEKLSPDQFEYSVNNDTATLTIKNVISYIGIYCHAEADDLKYEPIYGGNEYMCTGINEAYETEHGVKVTNIQIPAYYKSKKVTVIKDSAFANNTYITTISSLGNVLSIGSEAFKDCSNLATMPTSALAVTKIGDSAFYNCAKLNILNAPNVTNIGTYAFYGCGKMILASRFYNLVELKGGAFANCKSIGTKTHLHNDLPLIIGSGSKGKFDFTKMGQNVCDGWTSTQNIIFIGETNTHTELNTLGFNVAERSTSGYYYETDKTRSMNLSSTKGDVANSPKISFSDLDDFTWAEIHNMRNSGFHTIFWDVGDVKTYNSVAYRIIGFNHDTNTSGGLTGITFETVNAQTAVKFGDESQNHYSGSNLETTLKTVFSSLGSELTAEISKVKKKSLIGHGNEELEETGNELFPLSIVEVGGDPLKYPHHANEGTIYEYYRTYDTPKKDYSYWLRSPDTSTENTKLINIVDAEGNITTAECTNSTDIHYTYAFCI